VTSRKSENVETYREKFMNSKRRMPGKENLTEKSETSGMKFEMMQEKNDRKESLLKKLYELQKIDSLDQKKGKVGFKKDRNLDHNSGGEKTNRMNVDQSSGGELEAANRLNNDHNSGELDDEIIDHQK
jgi:hypothetical protein